MCWDLSEPSLSLILLWIIKYPHLSISPLLPSSPPPPPFLPPLPIHFFFCFFFLLPLSFSFSLMYLFYFWMYTALYPLRLFHLLLLSLHHCENGIRVLPWSCENTSIPPEGLAVREQSKERGEGSLFVVSHWIFHPNPWNIHSWSQGYGRGPQGRIVIMLLCLSCVSGYYSGGGGACMCVCVCVYICVGGSAI